jgi:hypothetical protein
MRVGDLVKRKPCPVRRMKRLQRGNVGLVLEVFPREGTGLSSLVMVLTNDGTGRPRRRQWLKQDVVAIHESR